MRYCGDDLNRSIGVIGRYPSMNRFMKDPFIRNEIAGMIEDAELMGYDLDDPEMMGGLIDGIKKIASAIRKRREARKSKGETAPSVSVQTSQGTAAFGPGGLTWTGAIPQLPQSVPIGNTGMQLTAMQQQESILDKIKKNPALLAGIAAVPVLLIVMSKKRSESK